MHPPTLRTDREKDTRRPTTGIGNDDVDRTTSRRNGVRFRRGYHGNLVAGAALGWRWHCCHDEPWRSRQPAGRCTRVRWVERDLHDTASAFTQAQYGGRPTCPVSPVAVLTITQQPSSQCTPRMNDFGMPDERTDIIYELLIHWTTSPALIETSNPNVSQRERVYTQNRCVRHAVALALDASTSLEASCRTGAPYSCGIRPEARFVTATPGPRNVVSHCRTDVAAEQCLARRRHPVALSRVGSRESGPEIKLRQSGEESAGELRDWQLTDPQVQPGRSQRQGGPAAGPTSFAKSLQYRRGDGA